MIRPCRIRPFPQCSAAKLLVVAMGFTVAGLVRPVPTTAQTNVRARYAAGQVWVSWQEAASPPETYAIYAKGSAFTSTNRATLVGRLFRREWLPIQMQEQVAAANRWRVPNPTGGYDTLAVNEGLFVETALASGSRWYAVVAYGDTVVTPGVNRAGPVTVTANLADPPECHLQSEYVANGQWLISLYSMWADGRERHWQGRPDFPVMANAYKNGMPSLFILSRPLALPDGPRPLVHWFHGGEGTAIQSIPGRRPPVNIDPVDGFLCAQNDDMIRQIPGYGLIATSSNSWFFGWTKHHDPFDSTYTVPADDDSVINYTQRRIVWINQWLIDHFPIDSTRVALQGHSMGSAGVTALGKSYPSLFSTVTVFNNGFGGPSATESDSLVGALVGPGENLFGTPGQNLPTNLRRANGETVHAYDLWNLTTPTSPLRDLPLFRMLHGKHDTNGTMSWDAYVVAQYRTADSLGLGMHLYWDERMHGLGAQPSYFSHGNGVAQQTERDNVAYQGRYRNDLSYPAFFNHHLYPDSHDPGDGTPGTTADPVWSGDDWGTWGGFHDWDPDAIIDEPTRWECPIWLIGLSAALPDNCPYDSLSCDVAIRRPQQFVPLAGTTVAWAVTSAAGDTLQSGISTVGADGLVAAPAIRTARDPVRRWLRFGLPVVTGVAEHGSEERGGRDGRDPVAVLQLVGPQPVLRAMGTTIAFTLARPASVRLEVHNVRGRRVATLVRGAMAAGRHTVAWHPGAVASGVYFVRLDAADHAVVRRLVVLE